MELTFKQKAAVFGIMLAIFACSILAKQWIDGKGLERVEKNADASVMQSEEIDREPGAETSEESTAAAEVILDVEGAVTYPGIVKISKGSRVYEAVEKAGGLLETADTKYVNLAEEVTDGSIIYIPFQGENTDKVDGSETKGSGDLSAGTENGGSSGGTGLININTADKNALMEIPGIGEAYAQSIIDYRTQNGSFKAKEDIKNVSGIGDAKYEKMKDMICTY